MDQMFDIYKSKADLYDSLVNHEDYNNNLLNFLIQKNLFANKLVCELGVGTGRVTKYYVDLVKKAQLYDVSTHMLDQAIINLRNYQSKISLNVLDNAELYKIKDEYDLVIEGWSFGHLLTQDTDLNKKILSELISNCKRIAQKVVIIETMGTNVDKPKAPSVALNQFYQYLVENGFKQEIISTDYKFDNVEQARFVMGSFFGPGMESSIKASNLSIIPEFTGIWIC